MSNRQVVRRSRNYPITTFGNRQLRTVPVNVRNLLRMAMRRRRAISRNVRRAQDRQRRARDRIVQRNRQGRRSFYRITGNASGTTHTTTRMIVRRTPRNQRFLRKLFKTNPISTKYVNRFGYAWMGASAASKCIWYSIAHLKLNNIHKYMSQRIVSPTQYNDELTSYSIKHIQALGNSADSFIYIGKCTFTYELYNPTNYIMTVWIYDLICKRDTPYGLDYQNVNNEYNNTPEACMHKSTTWQSAQNESANDASWVVADSTYENAGTTFGSIGMKPTDYHMFNTFWKVKGIKKIILPPTSSHHHVVIFNPKKKITNASLYFPHQDVQATVKKGLGGLTQATLFGFQGQVATENNQSTDNSNTIGTLPGKLLVSCVKKINVWNSTMAVNRIVQETSLKTTWTKPTIFTDLVEQDAGAT